MRPTQVVQGDWAAWPGRRLPDLLTQLRRHDRGFRAVLGAGPWQDLPAPPRVEAVERLRPLLITPPDEARPRRRVRSAAETAIARFDKDPFPDGWDPDPLPPKEKPEKTKFPPSDEPRASRPPADHACDRRFPLPVIDPDELAVWASSGLCRTTLGTNQALGLELATTVYPGFDDDELTGDEALRLLLPDWYPRYVAARAAVDIDLDLGGSDWARVPGLFWRGAEGYYASVIKMALRTVWAFAEFGVAVPVAAERCFGWARGSRAVEQLRDAIEGATFRLSSTGTCAPARRSMLRLDVNGVFAALKVRGGAANGAEYRGVVSYCDQWRVDCAVADYHFAVAKRLLAWARRGNQPAWNGFLAVLHAKAALAEIVHIGGEALHELGHIRRSSHCVEHGEKDWGACCQFLSDRVYLGLMGAHHGLPLAFFPSRSETGAARFRNDRSRYAGDLLGSWLETNASPCDADADSIGDDEVPESPTNAVVNVMHCALAAPHRALLEWVSGAPSCAPAGYGRGILDYEPSGGRPCCEFTPS